MTNKIPKQNNLKFQELHCHFTYSFVFDPSNWDSSEFTDKGFSDGVPIERLGWMPSRISANSVDNHKFIRLKIKKNTSGIGVQNIKLPETEAGTAKYQRNLELISDSKSINLIKKYYSTSFSTTVRLRRSGLGSVVICLRVQPKSNSSSELDFFDIEPLMRLVPSTWEQMIDNKLSSTCDPNFLTKLTFKNVKKNNLRFSLFDFYFSILKWLKNTNVVRQLKFDEIPTQIFNHKEYLYGIYNSENLSKRLKKIGSNVLNEHTAHPYIHLTAKMPEMDYKEMFLEDNEVIVEDSNETSKEGSIKITNSSEIKYRIRTKQIAALLFRFFDFSQYEFISSRYIKKELDCCKTSSYPVLLSHNANSKFFAHIYRMASISFYHEDKGIPYEVISKSMFDVIENSRAKFFGIQVANSLLDNLIYSINYIGSEVNKKYEYEHLISPLLYIEKFIAFSVADPSIMLLDGHVAFDIIDLVFEKMKVNETNKRLIEKLELVHRLINDSRSYKYLTYMDKI